MTETQTLQFESARALESLYAGDFRLLREIENSLGVRVTAREGSLRLEGEGDSIKKAKRVFDQLESARQSGVRIRRHEFNYALRAVKEDQEEGLDTVVRSRVQCSPRRPPIIARTKAQRTYIESIREFDMVFGLGPAGTGKTYLAMAMAVEALKKEQVSRIILTRPAVEAGEALGFLPGDLKEKIFPYLRPLYDALYDMLDPDEIERYMERGVVEIAPLAYMRGRTLNHAFIILDEAHNTTTEQMFMFLTRLGAESKCVVTGDQTQIDLPQPRKSGLLEALNALRDMEGICFLRFDERDVIRHELVQSIIKAYRRHRGGGAEEALPRPKAGANGAPESIAKVAETP